MGGDPDGVGIPASMGTGQPEGCPARATIILPELRCAHKHHSLKMGVPEQRRKRRMARLVSPLSNSGSYARLPILRQR